MSQNNPMNQLRGKLDKYAALTGAFLGSAAVANAGIVYTDLDPDQVADNNDVDIDFNGDGIVDFQVRQSGSGFSSATTYGTFGYSREFVGLFGNSSASYGFIATNTGSFFAEILNNGDNIGSAGPLTTNTWASVGSVFSSFYVTSGGASGGFATSNGSWGGQTDKFFGVYFTVGADTYYGWIRVDVAAGYGNAVVKDFAYEDQAGAPIAAGDMGSTACNSADLPTNLSHVNLANRVELSWDPNPGAVGCQASFQRLPSGPSPKLNVLSAPYNSANVPYAAAGAGTTWMWRVRCACSISPVDATAFTGYDDTFSVPTPREADMVDAQLTAFPNPASDQVMVGFDRTMDRETEVRVMDMTGRTVDFVRLPAEARNMSLDVSALENGVYFVQVDDMEPVTIEVLH